MDDHAKSDPFRSHFTLDDVRIESHPPVYEGYARVEKYRLSHRFHSGDMSPPIDRELFISGHAVIVLPFDIRTQEVLLIEQFRVAPLHRHETPWIYECIAGRIDEGETPEAVARREAVEEAGCTLLAVEEIGGYYPSPGIVAEHMTYFCGLADLADAGGIHGLDEEVEDIRAVKVGLDEALAALDENRFVSGPMALSLLWLARHRERLTERWQGLL